MDSDEDIMYDDVDSGNESSGDDVGFSMDEEPNNHKERQEIEEYPYEVLSTEQILLHMNESMKEVNTVVEVNVQKVHFIDF
jgi:ariadne-1